MTKLTRFTAIITLIAMCVFSFSACTVDTQKEKEAVSATLDSFWAAYQNVDFDEAEKYLADGVETFEGFEELKTVTEAEQLAELGVPKEKLTEILKDIIGYFEFSYGEISIDGETARVPITMITPDASSVDVDGLQSEYMAENADAVAKFQEKLAGKTEEEATALQSEFLVEVITWFIPQMYEAAEITVEEGIAELKKTDGKWLITTIEAE